MHHGVSQSVSRLVGKTAKQLHIYAQEPCIRDFELPYTFLFCNVNIYIGSRDSSVGIALGDQGSRVRFPAGAGNFFSSPPRP
jgi:hypothetical protein